MTFAALSSLISMCEMVVRILMDSGLTRKRALLVVVSAGFILGIPSAINLSFFSNQDWVWGLGLMVSGLFISIAVIKFGADRFRDEAINTPEERNPVGRWFVPVIKYLIPLEFLALMVWWFYRMITELDPEGWWHPFHTTSVGTTVLQWAALIGALLLLNRWWANRVGAKDGV